MVVANTHRLAAISDSKKKTDREDAKMLAQLLAAGDVPQTSSGRGKAFATSGSSVPSANIPSASRNLRTICSGVWRRLFTSIGPPSPIIVGR